MAIKKNSKKKIGAAIGIGLAAGAAYLLTGKKGKENRKKLKRGVLNAAEEIKKEIQKVGTQSKGEYERITKSMVEKYKDLTAKEIETIVSDLQKKFATKKSR